MKQQSKYPAIITKCDELKDGTYYVKLEPNAIPFAGRDGFVFDEKNPNAVFVIKGGMLTVYTLEDKK